MGAVKVLSVAGASIFGGLLTIGMFVTPKTPEERVDHMHKYMADGLDEMIGSRIHRNVIFDGYEIDDTAFVYKYTLTHIRDGRYSGADKIRIQEQMHEQVCSDFKMKRFLRADGVVRYSYKDSGGQHLFVIGFDEAVCGL